VAIWVDGDCKARVARSLVSATYPLVVGADVTPPYISDPFWGRIDEVRISDIARYHTDLEASFWLHKRTETYSNIKVGFSEGVYSSSNVGFRVYIGQHNIDQLWYVRVYDVDGTMLAMQEITYPGDRWINVTMSRTTAHE